MGIYGGHLSEFILLEVPGTQTALILEKRVKRGNIIFPDVFGNIKQINWVRFATWDKERGYHRRQGYDSFIKRFISRPSTTFIVLASSRLVKCWEHFTCTLLLWVTDLPHPFCWCKSETQSQWTKVIQVWELESKCLESSIAEIIISFPISSSAVLYS